jgi:hypothetical protein
VHTSSRSTHCLLAIGPVVVVIVVAAPPATTAAAVVAASRALFRSSAFLTGLLAALEGFTSVSSGALGDCWTSAFASREARARLLVGEAAESIVVVLASFGDAMGYGKRKENEGGEDGQRRVEKGSDLIRTMSLGTAEQEEEKSRVYEQRVE